jgi:hypothetical protein
MQRSYFHITTMCKLHSHSILGFHSREREFEPHLDYFFSLYEIFFTNKFKRNKDSKLPDKLKLVLRKSQEKIYSAEYNK